MNENTNVPVPGSDIRLDTSGVTSVAHHDAYIVAWDSLGRCWVCEERVSKPAHYRDRRGDVRIVHDWCIASAVTKDRRLYVEGG